ncbi:MAG: hypothetical protein CMB64_00525 [Euryarchaeota archaeon]|nr:hypothetical protein [Euryarchaeota archaeon]|tara:strand:- start:384 stop:1055 length:672 start_codon:yes stop_codon:yes gene_type:complete
MPNKYFRNIPDFEYVNRTKDGQYISNYTQVKNFFKKGKLREDIFQDLTTFQKYNIKGDDRPDNVANEIYGSPDLDWVVLLSNNIINLYDEWPLSQSNLDAYIMDKYGTIEKLNEVHHYESNEVKDRNGVIIFPRGVQVSVAQSVSYYESMTDEQVTINPISRAVTNLQYEEDINNKKRRIFLIKPLYLNVILDDLEEMMEYKEGSTQYVSRTLKRADNTRLYN